MPEQIFSWNKLAFIVICQSLGGIAYKYDLCKCHHQSFVWHGSSYLPPSFIESFLVFVTCFIMQCGASIFHSVSLHYFLHFIKVGTLDRALPFPADASSMSRANKGPASSALPWALAELTRRRPFVDTRRLVAICRNLPSDRVTADCGKAFLLFWNGGSIFLSLL